jgi:hypothetical protein
MIGPVLRSFDRSGVGFGRSSRALDNRPGRREAAGGHYKPADGIRGSKAPASANSETHGACPVAVKPCSGPVPADSQSLNVSSDAAIPPLTHLGRIRTTWLPSMKSRGEWFEVQKIQQTDQLIGILEAKGT